MLGEMFHIIPFCCELIISHETQVISSPQPNGFDVVDPSALLAYYTVLTKRKCVAIKSSLVYILEVIRYVMNK